MKKFIMTAIVICLSIATAIPFHLVKASTTLTLLQRNQNITMGTKTIGVYHTYGINSSSSGYIDVSSYGIFNADDTYKTGTMIYIGFDELCSGDLTLTFSGSISNYQYIVPEGDGVGQWNININNGRINVHWINSNAFVIYCFSTTYQATPSAQVGVINVNNYYTQGLDSESYTIPNYSLAAYKFTKIYTSVVYNSGDLYPHLSVLGGDVGSPAYLDGDHQYVYIFATNKDIGLLNPTFANNDVSYYVYGYTFLYESFYIYTMYIGYTPGDSGYGTIKWSSSADIYPFYFGDVNYVPNELYPYLDGQTYSQYLDEISMYLFQIRNLLQQSYNDQGQTSQDISDIADDFGDIADDEHQISSGFQDDLDDFNESIDLQDYDFLTGIANASEYFKIQLENVFNNSVNLRAMWVLPVICIVLLRLLGG